MSDIVERLNSQDELYHQPNFGWEIDEGKIEPLCMDAVAEILRLRAENEKLQWELGKALDTLVVHDAVCAENEKLRAALKPFLIEHWPEHNVYGYKMVFVTPDDLRAAAAVLNDKKNDNK